MEKPPGFFSYWLTVAGAPMALVHNGHYQYLIGAGCGSGDWGNWRRDVLVKVLVTLTELNILLINSFLL